MKRLWAKYQGWTERRRQKYLAWWSRERTKGRLRFHLWFTFRFVALMLGAMTLADLLIDHKVEMSKVPLRALVYAVTAVLLSFFMWNDNEKQISSLTGEQSFGIKFVVNSQQPLGRVHPVSLP
jgi:hypothetical protein